MEPVACVRERGREEERVEGEREKREGEGREGRKRGGIGEGSVYHPLHIPQPYHVFTDTYS